MKNDPNHLPEKSGLRKEELSRQIKELKQEIERMKNEQDILLNKIRYEKLLIELNYQRLLKI
jgi:hypothetical protein